jgi:hypothetical protein
MATSGAKRRTPHQPPQVARLAIGTPGAALQVGDVRQGYVRFEDRLRHHPAAPDRARLWVHDRLGDSPPLSCPRRAPQPHRSDTENKAVLSTEPMPR